MDCEPDMDDKPVYLASFNGTDYFVSKRGLVYSGLGNTLYVFVPEHQLPKTVLLEKNLLGIIWCREQSGITPHDGACLPRLLD